MQDYPNLQICSCPRSYHAPHPGGTDTCGHTWLPGPSCARGLCPLNPRLGVLGGCPDSSAPAEPHPLPMKRSPLRRCWGRIGTGGVKPCELSIAGPARGTRRSPVTAGPEPAEPSAPGLALSIHHGGGPGPPSRSPHAALEPSPQPYWRFRRRTGVPRAASRRPRAPRGRCARGWRPMAAVPTHHTPLRRHAAPEAAGREGWAAGAHGNCSPDP